MEHKRLQMEFACEWVNDLSESKFYHFTRANTGGKNGRILLIKTTNQKKQIC